ncbi:hypothetical protein MVEN_00739400 [Mycena venus]|uniref:Uncharacterized protein n=1 Tax=Mycena venus TaxID=2733690 RepID=A0A8H6YLH4_9AGAR|nr:hypothetical protein MVEN_00739400 [Mycena venus]
MQTRSARLAEAAMAKPNPSVSPKDPTFQQSTTAPQDQKPVVEKSSHCVRCHQSYKPSENRRSSCKIEHYEEDMDGVHSMGGYEWTLSCCGLSQWGTMDDGPEEHWKPKLCFVGPHTTQHQYDEDSNRIVYQAAGSCSECGTDNDSDDAEDSDTEEDSDAEEDTRS